MLDQNQTQPFQDQCENPVPPDTPVPAQGNSKIVNQDLQKDKKSQEGDNNSHASPGGVSVTGTNKADNNVEESNVVTPESKTNTKRRSVDGQGDIPAVITTGIELL